MVRSGFLEGFSAKLIEIGSHEIRKKGERTLFIPTTTNKSRKLLPLDGTFLHASILHYPVSRYCGAVSLLATLLSFYNSSNFSQAQKNTSNEHNGSEESIAMGQSRSYYPHVLYRSYLLGSAGSMCTYKVILLVLELLLRFARKLFL